ncbi:MAG: di-heme oxidoredictase family protein [Nitrospirota bacterium]
MLRRPDQGRHRQEGRRVGWSLAIVLFGAAGLPWLTAWSVAHAQLSERPGSSSDTSLGAKDVTGKSVKDRRVRVVHTTDPSLEGGSRYLQDVDPWLAFQRGRNLTQREFRGRDGAFGRAGSFFEPKLLGDRVTPRLGRDHVNSCGLCHGIPFREPGAGGNIPKGAGAGRNTPHFFGGGLVEMIGLQTRLKVLQACDPARRGFIRIKDIPDEPVRIAPIPGAPPVEYGWCGDRNQDGAPDLNKVFRVWYVDEEGRRVLADENGDGVINLRDLTVAGYNLEMMPFGWGETEGAMAPTLRVFFNDPIDTHTGMQAYDPTLQVDDGLHHDERAGDGLAAVSNAGARQFAIHAPADRGLRVSDRGLSLDDPDGDGAINEISEGDVDLAEWYMLSASAPGEGRQTPQTRRGRAVFETLGCAVCHVPDWRIEAASVDHADRYQRYDGDRRFFDLAVAYREPVGRLEGRVTLLADHIAGGWVPRRGSATVRGIFSDFKHHEMGPAFAETLFNGAKVTRFRTAPLWGVGSSAPYGHDGASLTLDDVIRRHGGEAAESATRYRGASRQDRDALVAFLRTLILYQSDQLPTDLDGDGRVSEHFMVAGQDSGVERFNPEWLFRTPCAIEGAVRAPDGSSLTSFACVNAPEAYGETLAWLRDVDDDGFPDRIDACPSDTGYATGCPEAALVADARSASAAPGSVVPSTVALAVDPRVPRIVWAAGTDGWGVKRSVNAGRTWQSMTTDPRAAHTTAVAVDPSDSNVVYLGSSSGVFVSRDGGGAWELRDRGMSDVRVFSLAVNPRSPHMIYAGGFGGRFYRSTDRGATWDETRIGSAVYRVTSLGVDAGDSSVPALENRPIALYAGTSGAGLFRSDDGGATWRALEDFPERIVYAIGLDPRISSTVYVGTPAGAYRSLDRGKSWALMGSGAPIPVLCLAIDPEQPATVLAGTPDGVMTTADGGRTWRRADGVKAAGPIVSVVLDPWNPRSLYAATFGGRVVGGVAR